MTSCERFCKTLTIRMAEMGVKNDRQLARDLGVEPSTVSRWRRDPGGMPVRQLRALHKLLKYTAADVAAEEGL